MHVIAVLALDGVVAFDLSIPGQVFGAARRQDSSPAYDVRVCAEPGVSTTACGQDAFRLSSRYGLDAIRDADTVVVPGVDLSRAPNPEALEGLREVAARGARIASICTGAFTLAAAGLLDGRRVTTHWQYAQLLQDCYPSVSVDPAVLYIDDGDLLTSAGVAAGLDLCLHMVRADLGASTAGAVARAVVMPPQRSGGQAQFIEHRDPDMDFDDLTPTMQWMLENLDKTLTLKQVASHAAMSTRSLSRRFRERTGTTPLRWLIDRRLQRARELLETTGLPIEQIAERVGFGSVEVLRHHFARHVGTSPRDYRVAFRSPDMPVR